MPFEHHISPWCKFANICCTGIPIQYDKEALTSSVACIDLLVISNELYDSIQRCPQLLGLVAMMLIFVYMHILLHVL